MKLTLADIVSLVVKHVNALGLGGASIALKEDTDGFVVGVTAKDASIASGVLEGLRMDDLSLNISRLKLGADNSELLANALFTVNRLIVRLNADLINSFLTSKHFLDELARNAPVEVRGLRLIFAGKKVTIKGEVRKIISFPFAIDLHFQPTPDNALKIVFENFWAADAVPLPAMVRRLIMSFAEQKLGSIESLKGVVNITDDYVVINPWPKVPLSVNAKFTRFGVESHYFVLELGADPDYADKSKPAKVEKDAAPVKAASASSSSLPSGPSILPLPSAW